MQKEKEKIGEVLADNYCDLRNAKLAKIEMRIKECERHGKGKVVVFVGQHRIQRWETIKPEEEK